MAGFSPVIRDIVGSVTELSADLSNTRHNTFYEYEVGRQCLVIEQRLSLCYGVGIFGRVLIVGGLRLDGESVRGRCTVVLVVASEGGGDSSRAGRKNRHRAAFAIDSCHGRFAAGIGDSDTVWRRCQRWFSKLFTKRHRCRGGTESERSVLLGNATNLAIERNSFLTSVRRRLVVAETKLIRRCIIAKISTTTDYVQAIVSQA